MTNFVHMEAGQWVLAYADGYFNPDLSVAQNLERLTRGGAGWSMSRRVAGGMFEILQVTRVMPNTFRFEGCSYRSRGHRAEVVAAAWSRAEIETLREVLIGIGFDADDQIDVEIAPIVEPIARRLRAGALAKVHAALPHIFGRTA